MQRVILILLILSLSASSLFLTQGILEHQGQGRPSGFLGDQFEGLKQIFGNVRIAGYYTDKNLDDKLAIAQFEQAQYVLAPTILDLNNTNYPLVLLDCISAQAAKEKVKELGLQPIKISPSGMILAINPKAGVKP